MIRWLVHILLSFFCLSIAGLSTLSSETWPFVVIFLVAGIGFFIKAIWDSGNRKCPECGRKFARDKEITIQHPIRFWHHERRITRYKPCKECNHRMDVKKEVKPRYWYVTRAQSLD